MSHSNMNTVLGERRERAALAKAAEDMRLVTTRDRLLAAHTQPSQCTSHIDGESLHVTQHAEVNQRRP